MLNCGCSSGPDMDLGARQLLPRTGQNPVLLSRVRNSLRRLQQAFGIWCRFVILGLSTCVYIDGPLARDTATSHTTQIMRLGISDRMVFKSTRSVSLRCTKCREAAGNPNFVCLDPATNTRFPSSSHLPNHIPTFNFIAWVLDISACIYSYFFSWDFW